jgi:hypothetical protein
MKRHRRYSLWPVIITLALVASALFVYGFLQQPRPNRNALAIGEQANVEYLDIVPQQLIDLDFMSKSQVLKLRTEAVYGYPQLIVGDYRPSDAVFGQIADGLPWWGILGAFYYGSGDQSIEGPSEQSLSILNPYLLAVPELYMRWDQTTVVDSSDFPLYCAPHHLHWFPSSAYAEVTYSAACLRENGVVFFSLIAYNARDLNLNYIFVSYQDSRNIVKSGAPTVPYNNPQFLHRGGSCGYSGGCNNISPQTPEIDNIQITGWPAKVVIWFWRHNPGSIDESPDMVFVIHFD